MSPIVIVGVSIVYLGLLFLIAFWVERGGRLKEKIVNNAYTYSLSLAVYCTARTFYGNVGRAATQGVGFYPSIWGRPL